MTLANLGIEVDATAVNETSRDIPVAACDEISERRKCALVLIMLMKGRCEVDCASIVCVDILLVSLLDEAKEAEIKLWSVETTSVEFGW